MALGPRLLHLAHRAVALPVASSPLQSLHLQARLFDILLALADGPAFGLRQETWSRHRRIADAARDILEAELANPPDMVALARRFGEQPSRLRPR